MKKAIAFAVAAAATASANAAWEAAGEGDYLGGEMILTVWNTETERSFSHDLGFQTANMVTALSNTGDLVFDLDADAVAWVDNGNADAIQWNVGGMNVAGAAAGGPATPDQSNIGIHMTGALKPSPVGGYTPANLTSQNSKWENYRNRIDDAVNTGTDEDPIYLLEGAFYAGNGAIWGAPMGGMQNWSQVGKASGSLEETLDAWVIGFEQGSWDNRIAYSGTWDLDLAAGQVMFTEVPVPAAAWLFMSGLVGLGAVARRRKA